MWRNIVSEIYRDEWIGTLTVPERLMWIALIATVADDQGRFIDNPGLVKSRVFPFDDEETIPLKLIEQGLEKFSHSKKILRYKVGTLGEEKKFIQIINWWKYQEKARWADQSKFPPPENWIDRCRYHGPENKEITLNWEEHGGFAEPT